LGSSIVAVDQFSNFPEQAKQIPHLKDHQKVSIDAIKEYKPDVILTGTVIQEKLAAELKTNGLPVYHQDPRTLEAVFKSIHDLSVVLDAEENGEWLVEELRSQFAALKEKTKHLPKKARVYVEEWHDPPMVSGNWVPDILRAAGVQSFPISSGDLSHEVSLEEVKKFDPDLIIISWCGAGMHADKYLLMKREGWENLRAVKERNVIVIDDSLLNRPGPRLIDGARQIYGKVFEIQHSAQFS
jgi:iron complex transport system substrate-binding protein